MKNVLILMGSPQKKGNTSIFSDEFARDAEEAGHKVEKINVISKKIAGCLGCGRTGIVGLLTIHGHRS